MIKLRYHSQIMIKLRHHSQIMIKLRYRTVTALTLNGHQRLAAHFLIVLSHSNTELSSIAQSRTFHLEANEAGMWEEAVAPAVLGHWAVPFHVRWGAQTAHKASQDQARTFSNLQSFQRADQLDWSAIWERRGKMDQKEQHGKGKGRYGFCEQQHSY